MPDQNSFDELRAAVSALKRAWRYEVFPPSGKRGIVMVTWAYMTADDPMPTTVAHGRGRTDEEGAIIIESLIVTIGGARPSSVFTMDDAARLFWLGRTPTKRMLSFFPNVYQ